jgi:Rho guanine nucleotide exchange factor 4/29
LQDISPHLNVKVRRANSAKVSTSSSIKASALKHQGKGSASPSAIAKRSLSQPSDLDVIVCSDKGKMMSNLENIKHIDDDDGSDTDSLTSNHVEEIEEDAPGVVYAEVLYQFEAGGPQELSLQKGSLVEVLKRESGPWWWGRLKYDAIVSSDAIEVQHGWFPKDFVRVIPTFGQNRKVISQSSTEYDCDNHLASLPPTAAAPSISSSQSNSEIMRDNVIKELLETEINYVKLLNSLVEG